MNIVVIDGQGGRLGKQIIEAIRAKVPDAEIIAIGSNSTATFNMMKGGATKGATGENSVVVACRSADIIVGTLGIVIADSLLGEITPKMAAAIGQSSAEKVLIPMNRCGHTVIGTSGLSVSELIAEAADYVAKKLLTTA